MKCVEIERQLGCYCSKWLAEFVAAEKAKTNRWEGSRWEGSGLSSLTFDLLAFTVVPFGTLSSPKSPARALAPPQPASSPLMGPSSTPRPTRDC